MTTVWKFPVPIADRFTLEVPAPARELHFGPDPSGQSCVWFLVDPEAPKRVLHFRLCGTGHELPPSAKEWRHYGSILQGPFVWHLFLTREVKS